MRRASCSHYLPLCSPSWPSDREGVRFGHLALSPQPLEAPPRRAGIMDGVPEVTVAEVVLDEPEIMALIGQGEAAGVSQRVRMHPGQPGPLRRGGDQVVDSLPQSSCKCSTSSALVLDFMPKPCSD